MVPAKECGTKKLKHADERIAIGAATLQVQRILGDTAVDCRTNAIDGGANAVDRSIPTIVFLHDSLGCIKLWRDFPERLCAATSCNGLIYDRQGYGESSPFTEPRELNYLEKEADVLIELLGCVAQPNRFFFFGHSDGGSIALIAAAKLCVRSGAHPFQVAGVITEGAHVFVEDVTLAGIRAAVAKKAQLLPRIRKYHGDKSEAVFEAWTGTWLKPEFRNFNMEHFLPDITCDVLVIQGEADEYGTEAQVDGIAAGVSSPGGPHLHIDPSRKNKLMVPGVGHTPHRDAADIVLAASTQFIAAVTSQV